MTDDHTAPGISLDALADYLHLATTAGEAPDSAFLVGSWQTSDQAFHSRWFRVADAAKAIAFLAKLAPRFNTFLGLGLRHPECPGTGGRGTSDEVYALAGLCLDLDDLSGTHASPHLPSRVQNLQLIESLPCRFSLIVDSGGGLYAHLLFKELWILDTEAERDQALQLMRRLHRTVQHAAALKGWRVDNTANLAACFRPTGTLNHKYQPPRPVVVLHEDPIRYNPSELSSAYWLAQVEDLYLPAEPVGAFPPTNLEPIVQGCAWLRHCQTDAHSLPEPEWYAMLGIVGRCEGGEEAAHAWSEPYQTATQKYSRAETARKLTQALRAAGPRTCGSIAQDLHGKVVCDQCMYWGKIRSPIVLGMPPTPDRLTGGLLAPLGWTRDAGSVSGGGRTRKASAEAARGHTHVARLDDARAHARSVFEQTAWYRGLIERYTNKRGITEANDTTICTFLRNHPYWQGKLWWDEMAARPMVGELQLDDTVLTHIAEYFGAYHDLPIRGSHTALAKCLTAVCQETKKDPLHDYLLGLPGWDGTPRLVTWLQECAGVSDDPYHQFVSRILIVSMIARAFEPGCLYRYVVVFQGPEEYRKSTFVAAMVPYEHWQDTVTESFESKDMPALISALWIAELSELDSLSRTEETRLKSFISKRTDPHVPKWALFRVAPLRRTIFIGTTNETQWLKGSSGNTRWLPVKIHHPMEVERLVTIREQLYAEAMLWYGDHLTDWWQMSPEADAQARQEREERRQLSVYEDDLASWLEVGRFEIASIALLREHGLTPVAGETSWPEIALGFLGMTTRDKWNHTPTQHQIFTALKARGWVNKLCRRHGRVMKLWINEPPPPF